MAIDFPASPTVGQQYTYAGITYTYTAQNVWSAKSTATSVASPSVYALGGRLDYVSATALKFAPYGGDQIKITGVLYTIPAAGIAGLNNPASVFIGATPNQPLVANRTYHVSAFNNGGVVTASFFVTPADGGPGHQPCTLAGMEGVEVMGVGGGQNPSYVLIGMIRTNASGQFQNDNANRFVISWFNRRGIPGQTSISAVTTTSTTLVELTTTARVNFLTWGEEAVLATMFGHGLNSNVATGMQNGLGLDGTTMPSGLIQFAFSEATASYSIPLSAAYSIFVTEGVHFVSPFANVSSGTGTWYLNTTVRIRG